MSDQRFAQDVHQTFADAGSFYISSMKGKAREQAVSFVGTGLATSLQANIENVIHNLANDVNFDYECVNYDFRFSQRDLSVSDNGSIIIKAPLDIDISSIDIYLVNNEARLLLPGVDFIQNVELDSSKPRFGTYINLEFFDNTLFGVQGKNLKALSLNINGTYTQDATIRNFLLKSYIGASSAPIGDALKFIVDYIGGDSQNLEAFENFINAMAGSTYFTGNWKQLRYYKSLATVEVKIKGYNGADPIYDNDIRVFRQRYVSGARDEISNSFYETNIINDVTNINTNGIVGLLENAKQIGNPIINYEIDSTFIGDVKASELEQAIENNLPFGYIQGSEPTFLLPVEPSFIALPKPPLAPSDIVNAQYFDATEGEIVNVIVLDENGNPVPLQVANMEE